MWLYRWILKRAEIINTMKYCGHKIRNRCNYLFTPRKKGSRNVQNLVAEEHGCQCQQEDYLEQQSTKGSLACCQQWKLTGTLRRRNVQMYVELPRLSMCVRKSNLYSLSMKLLHQSFQLYPSYLPHREVEL